MTDVIENVFMTEEKQPSIELNRYKGFILSTCIHVAIPNHRDLSDTRH